MQIWSFDPSANSLSSGNEIARLTRKATSVLTVLVARQGEVVSRDEILRTVWRDIHVTPDLVREYISDLRQALGDSAANPIYIETIRGKGFRLLGGVDLVRRKAIEPGVTQRARVAVLRPECLEGGERWQRFADGMADELVTDLARFSDIAVIARAASFDADKSIPIAEIAGALGCDYVVESSLSAWTDRLRANFRLVDGRSGLYVWADQYDRAISSLPELSGGIALAVANELGGTGGAILRAEQRYAGRRPPSALDAYENYVVASRLEECFDNKSMRRGLAHIDAAIGLDPDFARNHLVRAFFCDKGESISNERSQDEWLNEMVSSTECALRLDDRDPMILSYCARAFASTGRLAEANNVAIRAADLSENESHAALTCASALTLIVGEYELAQKLIDVADNLCPKKLDFQIFAKGRNLLFSGNAEEAESLTSSGPDFESTYVIRCLSQSLQGKREEARRTYNALISKYPSFSFASYPKTMGMVSETTLGVFYEAVERLKLQGV
ncbi:MAG: winged helix-turn-helix domain-containing protein [Pseudomonadota bacterium]